jgi:hypothetical protein
MKRNIVKISTVLLFLVMTSCHAQVSDKYKLSGLTEDIYQKLCGIWNDRIWAYEYQEGDFSWGKGKYEPDITTEIDLGADPPYISFPGFYYVVSEIREIEKNEYELVGLLGGEIERREEFVIHYLNRGTIWFEGDPEDMKYFKISGPDKSSVLAMGVCNNSSVRIRNEPSLESEILGLLNRGDKMILLARTDSKTRIGVMNDYWYRVRTDILDASGENKAVYGWVYGHFIDIE